MIAVATAVVDVFRDTDTNDRDGYYDAVETGTDPHLADVPVSILERTQRIPAEGMRGATYVVGRCSGELDVQPGDRLHDKTRDRWYAVSEVHQPDNPFVLIDKRLELISR